MDTPILVTGTAGFIGFSVACRLLDEGHRVVGYDSVNDYYPVAVKRARLDELARRGDAYINVEADLCDLAAMREVFDNQQPRQVCHLAAQAGVPFSMRDPLSYQRSNLEGFINILECCRHGGVGRLVYASSSSVYGDSTEFPLSESLRVDRPISLYAATKKANELMAHSYTHLYGLQTIGLRFFTVYGPWGRPDMALWIFAEKIINGEPISVFNNGRLKRDFTYIDDTVAGVVKAVLSPGLEPYEIFNLGKSQVEKVVDMIKIIEASLGCEATIEYLPAQPGDVKETWSDISSAAARLDYKPQTPIAEGIPRFCEWYNQHPELAAIVTDWRRQQ